MKNLPEFDLMGTIPIFPDGHTEMIVPVSQARILADRDTVVVQSERIIYAGDKLFIAGCEVLVVVCKYTRDYGQFNWLADVFGDCIPALREALAPARRRCRWLPRLPMVISRLGGWR